MECQRGIAGGTVVRIAALAVGLCFAVSFARAETLLVFAASSLRGSLDEVVTAWPPATDIAISYASSAALARQIEAGAPADLFISANQDWMAYLEDRGLVDTSLTHDLLANTLVLVGPAGAVTPGRDLATALAALPEDARIATGLLNAVPAGLYARQSLEATGWLGPLIPRIAQTENVRVALALAARGEVARSFVYRTDALADPTVAIEVEVPADLHDPIRYPVAVLTRSDHRDAEALFRFLRSSLAGAIFEADGFEVLE